MKQSVNADPYAGYIEGHMVVDMFGQQIDSDIKSYSVIEDGQIINYNYTGITDSWERMDSGISSAEYEEYLLKAPELTSASPEAMTLEEETTTIDGKEVYVLRQNMTGESMEALLSELGSMNEMMEIFEGKSMSELNAPTVSYIDTKTFLPVQIEMSIEGMDEFLNQILSETMEYAGAAEEDSVIAVSVPKCEMVMKNISYEAPVIPEIPQEVYDDIIYAEKLESFVSGDMLADGRYIYKYENAAIGLSEFEDYIIYAIDEGYAEIHSQDYMKSIALTAMYPSTVELSLEQMVPEVAANLGDAGIISELETISTHLGDVKVFSMTTERVNAYYAGISVKGMDLLAAVIDLSKSWENASEIMIPLTDAITEITLKDLE